MSGMLPYLGALALFLAGCGCRPFSAGPKRGFTA